MKLGFAEPDARVIAAADNLIREEVASEVVLFGEHSAWEQEGFKGKNWNPRVKLIEASCEGNPRLGRLVGRRVVLDGKPLYVEGQEELHRLERDSLCCALCQLSEGNVDGVVAGAKRPSGEVVSLILAIVGRQRRRFVFSLFVAYIAQEVFVFADAAALPSPSAWALARIGGDCAAFLKRLHPGVEPRVAYLSYATLESARSKDVEKMGEAARVAREKFPDLKVEGPIQGDAALDATVAARKGAVGKVAGRANVLIFPNIESGNIAYKLVERFAQLCGGQAHFVGPIILGTRAPANDASRGITQNDLVFLGMLTALQAREGIGLSDQSKEKPGGSPETRVIC